jgi:uncharacterized protein (DUF1778 family)
LTNGKDKDLTLSGFCSGPTKEIGISELTQWPVAEQTVLDLYGKLPYSYLIKENLAMAIRDIHETETRTSRNARLEARVTLEQKDVLSKAAALLGRSLTDFVVTSAYETAARTIREHQTMVLTERDRKIFVNALLNPPAPGPRLRKAARRYKQHFGE